MSIIAYSYMVDTLLKTNCTIVRDLFRGWGAKEFPTHEADFPSLEFLKHT